MRSQGKKMKTQKYLTGIGLLDLIILISACSRNETLRYWADKNASDGTMCG